MRFLKNIACSLFLLLTLQLTAQINQEDKLEFDVAEGYQNIYVYPLKTEQFLLVKYKKESKGTSIELDVYNNAFERENGVELPYDRDYSSREIYTDKSAYYRLNYNNRKGMFRLNVFRYNDAEIKTYTGVLGPKVIIDDMVVVDGYMHVVGKIKKKIFFYKVYNLETGKVKDLTFLSDKKDRIYYSDLELNEHTGIVSFSYEYRPRQFRTNQTRISLIHSNGNLTDCHKVVISDNQEEILIYVRVDHVGQNEVFVSGSYGAKTYGSAEGVYIMKMEGSKILFKQFYPFKDFKNFLTYLSDRRQAKIEKKKNRKERKGKDFEIKCLITMHDLIFENGIYYQVGECYYPTYRTETYNTTDANGRTVTQTRQVFDGYQYSHATILAFDKQGNKLWDQTFEMWLSNKPFSVKQFLTIDVYDGRVNCMFANGYAIKTMSFENGEIVKDRQVEYIQGDDEDEKIRSLSMDVEHWYSKNYITYGYQKIINKDRDKSKNEKRKRKVYFVRKITYGEEHETEGTPFKGEKVVDIF